MTSPLYCSLESTTKLPGQSCAVPVSQKQKGEEGGILTPATAMGAELRERIQAKAGLTFTLSE